MKTASAKAKGRRLQQDVAKKILEAFPSLEEDDVRSTAMGQGGEDVQLSPAARRLFPYSIECKSRASFALYKDFDQGVANTPEGSETILVFRGDRKKALVATTLDHFIELTGRTQTND
jgi:hypothetical protein